jgi:hypothetical protein
MMTKTTGWLLFKTLGWTLVTLLVLFAALIFYFFQGSAGPLGDFPYSGDPRSHF